MTTPSTDFFECPQCGNLDIIVNEGEAILCTNCHYKLREEMLILGIDKLNEMLYNVEIDKDKQIKKG